MNKEFNENILEKCLPTYLKRDIIETIENQIVYDIKELKEFFWDMFVVDSLVREF